MMKSLNTRKEKGKKGKVTEKKSAREKNQSTPPHSHVGVSMDEASHHNQLVVGVDFHQGAVPSRRYWAWSDSINEVQLPIKPSPGSTLPPGGGAIVEALGVVRLHSQRRREVFIQHLESPRAADVDVINLGIGSDVLTEAIEIRGNPVFPAKEKLFLLFTFFGIRGQVMDVVVEAELDGLEVGKDRAPQRETGRGPHEEVSGGPGDDGDVLDAVAFINSQVNDT